MRTTLLMSAALFAASVAAGHAQSTSGQTPPAPGAASQSVQPPNSLPPGSGTTAPGTIAPDTRGIRPTASPDVTTTPQPPAGGTAAATQAPVPRHRTAIRHRPYHASTGRAVDPENPGGGRAPADQYTDVPPTDAYQGGAGSPRSNRASNITRGDTHSLIAPRLPDPAANGNSPQAFLSAADQALARGQTGAAQEALERAQTRVLTRSTDPSMANMPDDSGLARAISDARTALANRDTGRARSIIAQVLNRGG